jgi:FKBP-type peptidyl-prolyl cis-trans isomerase (trigger factor)
VADKLKIEVTEEEINGHIAQIAIQRGQRPEKMKEQMERDGSLAQFRTEVRQNKCVNKLLESADITDKEPGTGADKPAKSKPAKKTKKKVAKKTTKKKPVRKKLSPDDVEKKDQDQ